ncbi:hypothetical protein N7447_005040 [Penicillium robsamsonii]|uniref:uncharacterized protein n=1 Tax=Penicillium robsamsonii TaxID=1792511 RepID=UPI002549B26E|nr:uncharacterized protein N7447_005040 [Penicillium robsamsonii]KAJ5822700.1 hypothetical protein N7447_005040 [Penicillium robsamsonii]
MNTARARDDSTIHLPRILCLHGGGTNARIFQAQCRGLIAGLKSEYRLVFAQAPFASQAGSDVLSVYSQWGPFRRWLRWRPEHPVISPEDAVQEIDTWLEKTMHQDDLAGATGEWIALLGFSQGAKVSASLLYRQQSWQELFGTRPAGINFRFGILLAGQAPFISMDSDLTLDPPLPDASQITDLRHSERELYYGKGHVLRIPTLHVHGLRDKGLDHHRKLFEDFCAPQSRRLIEWDGDHRIPLKLKDVSLVVHQIRELAKETGVS